MITGAFDRWWKVYYARQDALRWHWSGRFYKVAGIGNRFGDKKKKIVTDYSKDYFSTIVRTVFLCPSFIQHSIIHTYHSIVKTYSVFHQRSVLISTSVKSGVVRKYICVDSESSVLRSQTSDPGLASYPFQPDNCIVRIRQLGFAKCRLKFGLPGSTLEVWTLLIP